MIWLLLKVSLNQQMIPYPLTVSDPTVDAANLLLFTGKTDVTLTVHDPSVTTVSGKLADVLQHL